ncbi:uncharacterized protein FA14DRAFT_159891 [Meira miltonrushii]|uniref:Pre-mRNA-splicing factor CEF1 n=1 Tax=Meira miltonrushii TaxID=1280837 RepID=A0A316VL93_9BASI|nr:uncharacterized protein FA14DRAFT_159891 [Meira miltonrushii]PWN38230.1 hypothetical protein FA14DRAFT_159891 [Meira miltonrushii]
MGRIIIKGGVWKNTEDEILKAAICKYGKNQWARISSLLVRKTPKQCKARWYEWLDPSIKKTEWSKEEDEKLLHLAKLMPTQWRTIAPIVGRTATQCLERYQKLLDEAEQRENEDGAGPSGSGLALTGPDGGESAPSADEVRRLRPGEIDPDPETKPARPDAVDMDEDEKEMLSEARARLANTQGKKAKRKARERALEEARRLAMLQKKRELKAAGINVQQKKPKKGMDYMTDIPFEKQPVAGFYDTLEEDSRAIRAPVGRSIGQMDNPDKAKRDEEEKIRQKKEAERKKQSEEGKAAFSKQKEEQLRKLQESEQISKRRKLNLPEAQVGQRELDEIVKMGLASETARSLVTGADGGDESSRGLLGDYSALQHVRDARTPKTAPQDDTVMREARNLRNMANLQTPLLGDANVEMHSGTGNTTALPSHQVAQTPNPLLTPRNGIDGRESGSRTPQSVSTSSVRGSSIASTPMRTPLRDSFGLNMDDSMSMIGGVDSSKEMKRAAQAARARLQQGFMGLPAPKNDFDLVLDEDQEEEAQKGDADDQAALVEEDEADREAKLAKLEEEERKKEFARRSQVVQRNLPRPANVDIEAMLRAIGPAPSLGSDIALRVHHLIAEEMAHLAKHDSILYPIAGSTATGGMKSGLSIIPDENLSAAKELVRSELMQQLGVTKEEGNQEESIRSAIDDHLNTDTESGRQALADFEESLKQARESLMWDTSRGVWCDRSLLSSKSIIAGQSARLESIRKEMTRLATQSAKEEKKLGKLLGGYQARSKALGDTIQQSFRTMSEGEIEKEAYRRLHEIETISMEERMKALQSEVNTLERREKMAQGIYRDNDEERKKLQGEIELLEDEIAMREAEHLNEEALQNEA